ncbi:MAG: pentapeptide repeat-containing protein, partial [Pirellulales bacterium]|nr:pentapeptide repeat-containing protein [Pirellulales bacterium]
LRLADLRLADLRLADLRLADLRLADLRLADLRLADLRLADLRLADLRPADLRPVLPPGGDARGSAPWLRHPQCRCWQWALQPGHPTLRRGPLQRPGLADSLRQPRRLCHGLAEAQARSPGRPAGRPGSPVPRPRAATVSLRRSRPAAPAPTLTTGHRSTADPGIRTLLRRAPALERSPGRLRHLAGRPAGRCSPQPAPQPDPRLAAHREAVRHHSAAAGRPPSRLPKVLAPDHPAASPEQPAAVAQAAAVPGHR